MTLLLLIFYLLVSKIEMYLQYFLDKNSQKQPLWFIKKNQMKKKLLNSSKITEPLTKNAATLLKGRYEELFFGQGLLYVY